jgi:hypothetical protein
MGKKIIYPTENNGVAIITPILDCGLTVEQIAAKDVPIGVPFKIINASEVPADFTFRAAWEYSAMSIIINLNKAKDIGHTMRRDARTKEFAPYDEIISKQIPGASVVEAEAARQAIREKYAVIQLKIDAALTPEEIKQALEI